jgi:hypothetical protein
MKKNFGDLKEDDNLVSFFRTVLDRRDHLDEGEQWVEVNHSVKDTVGASSVLDLSGIRTRRTEDSHLWLTNFVI